MSTIKSNNRKEKLSKEKAFLKNSKLSNKKEKLSKEKSFLKDFKLILKNNLNFKVKNNNIFK